MLNDTFKTLQNNLYYNTLFYVPKSVYHHLMTLGLDKLIPFHKLNTLIYHNEEGLFLKVDYKIDFYKIMSKTSLLNDNLFRLTDEKKQFAEGDFKMLLNKYLEHLNALVYVTSWLDSNSIQFIPHTNDANKKALKAQAINFKNHLNEINSQFGLFPPSKKQFDLDVIVKTFKNVKNSQSKIDVVKKASSPEIEKNTKRQKKEKPILITDQESENFLLETIFNIDKSLF